MSPSNMERAVERLEGADRELAASLAEVAKTCALVQQEVQILSQRTERIGLVLDGTHDHPGLEKRVDRIEIRHGQAMTVIAWIFGGGVVTTAGSIVCLFKVIELMSKS